MDYNCTDTSYAGCFILNQDELCDTFELVSKPYAMLATMSFTSLVYMGILFPAKSRALICAGSEPWSSFVSTLKVLYSGYTIGTYVYELFYLALRVQSADTPAGFPQPTTWDKYEMTCYLWVQSAVGSAFISSVSNILQTTLMAKYRSEVSPDLDGEYTYQHTCECSALDFYTWLIFYACFTILPLLPVIATHILPMMVAYIWWFLILLGAPMLFLYTLSRLANRPGETALGQSIPDISLPDRCGGSLSACYSTSMVLQTVWLFYLILILTLQSLTTFGILLYGGSRYVDVLRHEVNSRRFTHFTRCLDVGSSTTYLDAVRSWF